jgi:diguanylate cyclase (GGDEF)-like protein
MLEQTDSTRQKVGLFLNPVGQRRVDFQNVCGAQFGHLFVADGVEQAIDLLARQPIDALVIDLERFERSIDLASLSSLIEISSASSVLLVCPFDAGEWLPSLMSMRELDYVMGPLADAELRAAVAALLAREGGVEAVEGADGVDGVDVDPGLTWSAPELRVALAMHARLQRTIAEGSDLGLLAEQVCESLCAWPGVVHASLFHLKKHGDLRLEAQHAAGGPNLHELLGRGERLLESPLRHAFPGLLAAFTGEIALLDAPEKSGEPQLAAALRGHGVAMVLGLPVSVSGAGTPAASLCLMFERQRALGREELAALSDLAQLVGVGIRLAELTRESEQLVSRMTSLSTQDALTGVANRQRGEALLEQEMRRARRYKLPLAVIAFDIDHFKTINERYGYAVGDLVLRVVADTCSAALRSSDLLSRSGGEEFQILALHTSAIDALKVAEKLRLAIAEAVIPGCDHITISLGVAQLSELESVDALYRRVQSALARAKRAGRNCVELAMA